MPNTEANSIIFPPPTKQPVPPPYRGLPDSATFARLASRPDRIDPEAAAFFESWILAGIAIKRKDGRLVIRPEFIPIGTAGFFEEFTFSDVTSGSSSTTTAAAAATKK
jgi:hypothetical protein